METHTQRERDARVNRSESDECANRFLGFIGCRRELSMTTTPSVGDDRSDLTVKSVHSLDLVKPQQLKNEYSAQEQQANVLG